MRIPSILTTIGCVQYVLQMYLSFVSLDIRKKFLVRDVHLKVLSGNPPYKILRR